MTFSLVRHAAGAVVSGALLLACLTGLARADDAAKPEFVTSMVCATCHEGEAKSWRDSQHAGAMQVATEATVLAPFDGEIFEKDGVTSTFFRRDGKFFVNTDGPDGELGDFEITYTFGLTPLQQYLVAMPGGHYQALGIAWDTRPAAQGGERWFHLYPGQKISAGNPLHWTGIDQNWNYQCAWCHSTNLQKNYDPAADTFATTWSEISVGCEACHGPGSDHVAWAGKPAGERSSMDNGLIVALKDRAGVHWEKGNGPTATRSTPRMHDTEIDACAGCHARRGQFAADPASTIRLFDAFRPSTLGAGLYHPDGQQQDEVYKYASFLQSRMYAAGVTCSDCHDPHSGKLVLEGNAVCGQCHEPQVFDTADHHHHQPETKGAECVSCHMPTTNYMIVDPRHDHSMRIPRPDRSVSMSVPNACNNCHTDKDAAWAAAAIAEWNPDAPKGAQDFAELFAAADAGLPGSRDALIAYLDDDHPAIVTASVLERLAANPTAQTLQAVAGYLGSDQPLVQSAAVRTAALADVPTRLQLLIPLLTADSRLVRIDAARALAGEAEAQMDAPTRAAFDSAIAEYIAAEMFNAERPEANVNLAELWRERGDLVQARTFYETAMKRDPTFAPAVVGLAQLLGGTGDPAASEALLRKAATDSPDSADIAHALGLALIRAGKRDEAMTWLQKAAGLGTARPRYAYVYAIALHDTGDPEKAIAVLKTALRRYPYDHDLLSALLSYSIEKGDLDGSLAAAEMLGALDPTDQQVQGILQQLRPLKNR